MDRGKPKLLILEDDFENQRLLDFYLKKSFKVDICDTSESFNNKISNNKYDIFLVDISLKGDKDGLDLTRQLRGMEDYKNVPIICISAHVYPDVKPGLSCRELMNFWHDLQAIKKCLILY